MIKQVIFDLGQVLVKVDLQPFYINFGREFDIDPTKISGDQIDGVHHEFMLGKITGEEFHRITCERLGRAVPFENFKAIWISMLVGEMDGIAEIISSLHRQNYSLALLSNTDSWHFEYCNQNFPILKKLTRKFLSYDLHMKKPDAEIFLTVARNLNVNPAQCLFIDDLMDNVLGAQCVDFNAIQFNNAEQLRQDLQRFGIEVK